MYTNNYNAFCATIFQGDDFKNISCFNTRSTVEWFAPGTLRQAFFAQSNDTNYYFIVLAGSGDKKPTITDDGLTDEISSEVLRIDSNTSTVPFDHSGYEGFLAFDSLKTITTVFKNVTDEPVTVKEIGLWMAYDKNPNAGYSFMIAREVLPTPVIIQPHEKQSFTMIMGTN